MTDDEQPADREIVRSARREAAVAVRQFNQARADGDVSRDVRRELANAALNYYDALYEYRDERALATPWDERGLEWLEAAVGEQVAVEQSLPRPNGASETVTKPKLMVVDPDRIRDTIRELNDVAKELGFAPAAKDPTPNEEASPADLAGLLEARGQDKALENLPDSWTGDA